MIPTGIFVFIRGGIEFFHIWFYAHLPRRSFYKYAPFSMSLLISIKIKMGGKCYEHGDYQSGCSDEI